MHFNNDDRLLSLNICIMFVLIMHSLEVFESETKLFHALLISLTLNISLLVFLCTQSFQFSM